jgi:hypothetical protein
MDRSTFAHLSGADAAVALRSLARRFREQFRPGELAGDPVAADVSRAAAAGGPSPLQLVISARQALSALGRATELVLTHDRPQLDPALGDRAVRDRVGADDESIVEALDGLGRAADALADRAEHVSLKDWGRTGLVGGTEESAIGLVQEAIASARTYLDQLAPALDGIRRAPN